MVFRSRRSAICNLPMMRVGGGRHLNVLDFVLEALRYGLPQDLIQLARTERNSVSGQPLTRRELHAACDPRSGTYTVWE